MAWGVPLEVPVAGAGVGKEREEEGAPAVGHDSLGDEDQLGDMEFKVAGT